MGTIGELKIWYGMGAAAWLRLLWRNRFAVDRGRRLTAIVATLLSLRNTVLGGCQRALLIVRPPPAIALAPVFIVGHWRSGTTWLHEMLALDDRHTAPTTYECFAPGHFLLTERIFTRWIHRVFAPVRRPMDRMAVGWGSPQEDEFAMLNLGQPSAYMRIAFPDAPWTGVADLQLDLSANVRRAWTSAFLRFLTVVSSRRSGRLVLKSPLHLGRIRLLLEIFPDARFVHIVRDPYAVFASTVRMWQSLSEQQGLQDASGDRQYERVFATFVDLHARFDDARGLIPEGRLVQVRYEDLVRDPMAVLRTIYEHLNLGAIEPAQPRLRSYLTSIAGHEGARYSLTPATQDEITRRWGSIIREQGYAICTG